MIGGTASVNTPGSQDAMHGKSSHIMHADVSALMMGVPATLPKRPWAFAIAS